MSILKKLLSAIFAMGLIVAAPITAQANHSDHSFYGPGISVSDHGLSLSLIEHKKRLYKKRLHEKRLYKKRHYGKLKYKHGKLAFGHKKKYSRNHSRFGAAKKHFGGHSRHGINKRRNTGIRLRWCSNFFRVAAVGSRQLTHLSLLSSKLFNTCSAKPAPTPE